ncbi:MAG: sodium:proton antiporter [Lawsonibacter sp.]|nr:sodium:proton antiporter [Lawsonibacter sp.]
METAVLGLFVCILLCCVLAGLSVVPALVLGYLLFALYALRKGFSPGEVWNMSFQGIKTTRNILTTFVLIGVLTALWRAGGTIPAIVCGAVRAMTPGLFFLFTYLLNCLVSFLTGTAFGTAATMGAVCAAMGRALEISPVLTGGAVLSGVYFGDRCSPVSTSALLVAEVTGTGLYGNIRAMVKSAAVPFALTCGIYALCGVLFPPGSGQGGDVTALFRQEFRLGLAPLVPAALILILSLARAGVKTTMAASIAAAAGVCLLYQGLPAADVLRFSLLGFSARSESLSPMIDGGGVASMVRVGAIVCISSCYAGIFQKTGLLDPIRAKIGALEKKASPFGAMVLVSAAGAAASCNQTLTILLTRQLCAGLGLPKEKMALYLENSAVVIAPLIPWSIAGSVPLASAGAPALSLAASFFLFLLPAWQLICPAGGEET